MIYLRNAIIIKEILENENPNKMANFVKKILNFNKQRKGKGLPSELATQLKILTPKQRFQIFSTALAQVKAGNTYENLLDEIRQFICYLYRTKEITKKVCNNIINSMKL